MPKSYLQPIDDDFLAFFKRETEAYWKDIEINPCVYGYQFQSGTRWNAGLNTSEIEAYENALGTRFPNDFKKLLSFINGTDLPMIFAYDLEDEPRLTNSATEVGIYSYPRDLQLVQRLMQQLEPDRADIAEVLSDEDFQLEPSDVLVPIYGHRFIVCGSDPNASVVVSIVGIDAIIYSDSLRNYVRSEFL